MSYGFRQHLSGFCPSKPTFTEFSLPDLSNKVYLVTGSTSGIGLSLAGLLYSKNAHIYITSRSAPTAERVIKSIQSSFPTSTGKLSYLVLNLSDLHTIAPAAKEFLKREKRLHVAWYNAGIMNPQKGSQTAQNYEVQWGTNVLGHFLLDRLIFPALLATAADPSSPKGSIRTVWVSSDGHGLFSPKPDGVDWDDIATKKPAEGWEPERGTMWYYGQSKAGNVLLALETAKRYFDKDIVSVSLNPGHLRTNLDRGGSWLQKKIVDLLFNYDVVYGAYTELYAGLSEDISQENNGAYLIPWGRVGAARPDIMEGFEKRGTGKRLWEYCEKEVQHFMSG
ncbi:MAG: hypothetical protein M1834_003603 [Cirrosporium novae-zelandiae]|nr:MAG: hypothetical protein M1834_003603 [Cirrosporium novae-zelandiae]